MINSRHCEERSDEAIQSSYSVTVMDCFAALAMTERTTAKIAHVMRTNNEETP
jgi:hypothetical protein